MQSHNVTDLAVLLDDFLPRNYTPLVIDKLHTAGKFKKKYTSLYIRQVRKGLIKNAVVLTAIIELATQEKKDLETLRDTAKKSLAN